MPQKPQTPAPISIVLYKWAGRWGPFKIKIPCGECALTEDVIDDVVGRELGYIPVEIETRDWLSNWWKPLFKGGWHAPIVLVEGEVIAQGDALNRGVLTEKIVRAYAKRFPVTGNRLFSKPGCKHCVRAKTYLDEAGIEYETMDVIANPAAMYEMLARVKPIIGEKTPITTPQVFLDGVFIGGADELGARLSREIEPDGRRGKGALSPPKGTSKKKRRAMVAEPV